MIINIDRVINNNYPFIFVFGKRYLILLLLFVVFPIFDVSASAWTRGQGELFGVFEILDESNYSKTLFIDKNLNYYRTNSYKLYLEYGLFEKYTIGGYVKNYNFYSQFYHNWGKAREKIKNDYYANVFLIQNLYNKNNNLFSLEYSVYFPIKYDDVSKYVNTVDTKESVEFVLLFGRNGKLFGDVLDLGFKYYICTDLSYKFVKDIEYDEIVFATTVGIMANELSAIKFHYEYQHYVKKNLLQKDKTIYTYYEGSNTNQIKLAFEQRFLDNLATEFAFYKNYSRVNSTGFTFSFIFNFD